MNKSTSFDEIYRQHSSAVYRVCMRAVSRREVAEELTSEVFLALHQSWESLTEDQIPAWLFTVAKRRAADYWRHHYVQERWLQNQREDNRWAEPEFKLEVLLSRCPNLKPIHRVCTTLRFAHGMSRAEIAETTRLTELQVKGHLQYALQLLRQQMVPPAKSETTGEALHDA